MTMNISVGVLAFALVFPAAAAAQSASLAPGARVRITAPDQRLKNEVGGVEAVQGDSLVFVAKGSRQAIALTDVTRIEISAGRRKQLLKHMGIGLAAGAVTGGVIGAVTYEECVPEGFLDCLLASDNRGEEAVLGGAMLGVVGLVAGTVAGLIRRPERWESVELPLAVAIGSSRRGGVSLGFSRAF